VSHDGHMSTADALASIEWRVDLASRIPARIFRDAWRIAFTSYDTVAADPRGAVLSFLAQRHGDTEVFARYRASADSAWQLAQGAAPGPSETSVPYYVDDCVWFGRSVRWAVRADVGHDLCVIGTDADLFLPDLDDVCWLHVDGAMTSDGFPIESGPTADPKLLAQNYGAAMLRQEIRADRIATVLALVHAVRRGEHVLDNLRVPVDQLAHLRLAGIDVAAVRDLQRVVRAGSFAPRIADRQLWSQKLLDDVDRRTGALLEEHSRSISVSVEQVAAAFAPPRAAEEHR
jgi:hypothetical protein